MVSGLPHPSGRAPSWFGVLPEVLFGLERTYSRNGCLGIESDHDTDPGNIHRQTWHSFEAELDELYDEAKRSPPTLRGERIADQTLARTYERSTDPRLVLLQMSVEIESKLAQIAERHGLEKQSFYQIIDLLRQKEILTDSFVINGLRFFREQRNALVHQGRVPELAKAIDIGRTLLAKLEETP